jgi:acyl dehydratase
MRYLSDFEAGQRFFGGPVEVRTDEVIAFGRQYDPQPFHTDAQAAEKSFFNGLAASGWLTAALTMRMLVGSGMDIPWGVIGREIESLGWPRPVRPGDSLRVVSEVRDVRPSRSRPEMGVVRMQSDTFNQKGELVQTLTARLIVPVGRVGGDHA